jgi:hypothetical protein
MSLSFISFTSLNTPIANIIYTSTRLHRRAALKTTAIKMKSIKNRECKRFWEAVWSRKKRANSSKRNDTIRVRRSTYKCTLSNDR